MNRIPTLKSFHVHLKQDGKQLKLIARIKLEEANQRLKDAQLILPAAKPIKTDTCADYSISKY